MSVPPSTSGGDAVAASGRTEMVLSEERLAVSTVRVPARRVRLEKYVVTETRTITVELSREEVRLVEVDATEGGDTVFDSAADADARSRWLTLSEERVAITTEVVPVERVRLDISTVVENRPVTGDVRREEVVLDADSRIPRGAGPGATDTTPEDTV